MNYAFNQYTLGWLIITTVISIFSGYLSSLLTYKIKRREIRETALADLKKLQNEWKFEAGKEKKERLREEVRYWANPILTTTEDLIARMKNIIYDDGYLALSIDYKPESNPNWSVTYEYFMESTLFAFSNYFAWIRMLHEKLNYELFQTEKDQKDFFDSVWQVTKALGDYHTSDVKYKGKDTQVFALQQRAIGELLIEGESENKRSMSYPDFLKKTIDANSILNHHLQPLRTLLDNITKDDEYRWNRLNLAYDNLINLQKACKKLLALPEETTEATSRDKIHNYTTYDKVAFASISQSFQNKALQYSLKLSGMFIIVDLLATYLTFSKIF